MKMHQVHLSTVAIVLLMVSSVSAETWFITPSSQCFKNSTNESCVTLSQFTANTVRYFSSITLILLPGDHILNSRLLILNILNSVEIFASSNVTVTCSGSGRFSIQHVPLVYIRDIQFIGCRGNSVLNVDQFSIENCHLHGQETQSTSRVTGFGLNLRSPSVHIVRSSFSSYYNPKGIGALGVNGNSGYSIYIENSLFQNNVGFLGGAIYVHKSNTLIITNVTFSSNMAAASGGAIYSPYRNTTLTIEYSIFNNNSANIGGALHVIQGQLFISLGTFSDNVANSSGGAISATQSTITIYNSMFLDNRVESEDPSYGGGALFILSSSIEVNDSSFIHNFAATGGAIYTLNNEATRICNSILENNTARRRGGAMYVLQYPDCCGEVSITNCTFSDNIAASNISLGGAFADSGSNNLTITNSSFTCNVAGYIGGAVYAVYRDSKSVTIENSVFSDNQLTHLGGGHGCAMYVTSGDGDVTISNSTFTNNTMSCKGVGGAISAWTSRNILVEDSFFSHNIAARGGGIFSSSNEVARIHSSVFYNNTACYHSENDFNVGGGAMYIAHPRVIVNVSITNCTFINNTAASNLSGGGAINDFGSNILTITNSSFLGNEAGHRGGALHSGQIAGLSLDDGRRVTINNSTFHDNQIYRRNGYGGAIYVDHARINGGSVAISSCLFTSNTCIADDAGRGGALIASNSQVMVDSSTFDRNRASYIAGAISTDDVTIVNDCVFSENVAIYGGAMYFYSDRDATISVTNVKCLNNMAETDGGALYVGGVSIENLAVYLINAINITNSHFVNNSASRYGEAMYINSEHFTSNGLLNISDNSGGLSVVYASRSELLLSGNTIISNNCGAFMVIESNVTFQGTTQFSFNKNINQTVEGLQQGGAVTAFQSNVMFDDTVSLISNEAENGAAIFAVESSIYMNEGNKRISHNSARLSGGGIYAYQSELNFKGTIILIDYNTADNEGGGIHAISSTARLLEGTLIFTRNHASRGGGIFLESNAKLYVVKSQVESYSSTNNVQQNWLRLSFTDNSAEYGGAIYVTDDTNSGTCASDSTSVKAIATGECFFQSLTLYEIPLSLFKTGYLDFTYSFTQELNIKNTFFRDNSATISGHTLHGGLLDRCTVSPLTEFYKKFQQSLASAFSNLEAITDIKEQDIASDPVRVCFCNGDQPDCSYQPDNVRFRKGERFALSVVAIDQVGRPTPSIIHSSLESQGGTFSEGQLLQTTSENCTGLEYNILSPHDSERLLLYAEGPCRDIGISQRSINVTFLPCTCPIGFEPSNTQTNCECVCDTSLTQYVTNCYSDSRSILREGDFWITYLPDDNSSLSSEGYVIYPNCPFDYCYPPTMQVSVNLNIPNGADAQCAFNRSGILCGSCQEGLSLSLGSSRCMPCSNHWLVLLLPFTMIGVALVAFLLLFNLTVHVGTINGLIFYANIIVANSTIFFPFENSSFLTIFIAWLNLDFGFETCFYDGMDGYAKVWLQLAFPFYIFFLVAMLIIISDQSWLLTKMPWLSRLLSSTNQVATLATLILLSYAKLLRTIIAALSFATLEYPDGSHKVVWRYDANIPYLEGKHIPLFVAALLILLVGLAYTLLLFFWQWLLKFSNMFILKWCNNHKLQSFMDVYTAPYKEKHWYWTGLLLSARVLLYLIAAVNLSGDPSINLLSTICVVGGLLLWKTKYRINKKWLLVPTSHNKSQQNKTDALRKKEDSTPSYHYFTFLNGLASLFIFNLLIFSAATYHVRETNGNQAALAYTSTIITFITFMWILFYHLPYAGFVLSKTVHIGTFKDWKEFYDSLRNFIFKTKNMESNSLEADIDEINNILPQDRNISLLDNETNDISLLSVFFRCVCKEKTRITQEVTIPPQSDNNEEFNASCSYTECNDLPPVTLTFSKDNDEEPQVELQVITNHARAE